MKIVSDGVIDACTAAMLWPYANGTHPPAIWEPDALRPAVVAADAAGLQIAIHAIGDAAIRNALDAFEEAARVNGTSGRRHRIEHIELPDPADIPRFGPAGVTASMQPVHADPGDPRQLGGDARRRARQPRLPLDGAARLDPPGARHRCPDGAAGGDPQPVHRHDPAVEPGSSLPAPPGEPVLDLATALRGMTLDAAWSCGDELERGSLEPGKLADLTVIDTDPFERGPEALLDAHVLRTIVGGRTVYER